MLYNLVSSSSCHIVPCSFVSGSLLQLKLFRGLPGVGTFFFALGAVVRGARGAKGAGGGAGAGGAGGRGGGHRESGGGGGTEHVSMTALFRLLTYTHTTKH